MRGGRRAAAALNPKRGCAVRRWAWRAGARTPTPRSSTSPRAQPWTRWTASTLCLARYVFCWRSEAFPWSGVLTSCQNLANIDELLYASLAVKSADAASCGQALEQAPASPVPLATSLCCAHVKCCQPPGPLHNRPILTSPAPSTVPARCRRAWMWWRRSTRPSWTTAAARCRCPMHPELLLFLLVLVLFLSVQVSCISISIRSIHDNFCHCSRRSQRLSSIAEHAGAAHCYLFVYSPSELCIHSHPGEAHSGRGRSWCHELFRTVS